MTEWFAVSATLAAQGSMLELLQWDSHHLPGFQVARMGASCKLLSLRPWGLSVLMAVQRGRSVSRLFVQIHTQATSTRWMPHSPPPWARQIRV